MVPANSVVRGIQGTGKWYGSSADEVMGRIIGIQGN